MGVHYSIVELKPGIFKITRRSELIETWAFFRCNYQIAPIFKMARNQTLIRAIYYMAYNAGQGCYLTNDSHVIGFFILDFMKD